MGVLLYHADISWLPGGFLGVEVFFVVSGYLITALLLRERAARGRIDLKQFWIRRARRLLPALGVFLAGSYGLAVLVAQDVVDEWHEGVWAATFYVANWFGIANDISYAEGFGRKSFLHHLWSLAVEEQFYLLWPLILWFGLRWLGRRGTLLAIVGLAAASATLMWILYEPLTDPVRVYYGTDTRASGLLIGAAMAFVWRPWEWTFSARSARRMVTWVMAPVGITAAAVLAWAMWWYDLALPSATPLFHGGFLVVSISTALLIAALVVPKSPIAKLLGVGPLKWIGTRSYGLYLWHWPIYQVTRPRVDVELGEWTTLALRLVLTAAVAELSYRAIEQPIRQGQYGRRLRLFRARPAWGRILAAPVGVAMIALVIVGVQEQLHEEEADEVTLVLGPRTVSTIPPITSAEASPTAGPASARTGPTDAVSLLALVSQPSPLPIPTTTVVPIPVEAPPRFEAVTFIGDSVMEGAAANLIELIPDADIDTLVGRHWFQAPDLLAERIEGDTLGDAVVIHLGNNGPISEDLFDETMAPLSEVDLVVFVNVRVPVRWEGPVNEEIAAGVERWDNAVLVDWFRRSNDKPKFFASDGVHLGEKGRRAYVKAIAKKLGLEIPTPTPTAPPEPLATPVIEAEPTDDPDVPQIAPPPSEGSTSDDGDVVG